MKKRGFMSLYGLILTIAVLFFPLTQALALSFHTVQAGDTLYKISVKAGVGVPALKEMNSLASDTIYPGQRLNLFYSEKYTVQSGDTLWLLAQKYKTAINDLKTLNRLSSDALYIGQTLTVPGTKTPPPAPALDTYTVQRGDSLWLISQKSNTTVIALKTCNSLTSDTIHIGQVLKIPAETKYTPVMSWPSVTYVVQSGDTLSKIAAKYGTAESLLFRYNYMEQDEWLNAGQKIAVSDYAPRYWAVVPGEDAAAKSCGKKADWFFDGQYVFNRNDVFTLTDYRTGEKMRFKMMGGVNHADVEPLTEADTAALQKLFPVWKWDPRPVVVFHDGMNIAASLSGMPHSYDTVALNGVTGHFDLYLKNSKGHSETTLQAYVAQHMASVEEAATAK